MAKKSESNLTITHPNIAAEWDYEKNGGLKPEQFSYGSRKKVWWRCHGCGESFQSEIKYRTLKNKGCNPCKSRPKYKDNNITVTHPEISKMWDYQKNEEMLPTFFSHGSCYKAWWKCDIGHSFQRRISDITTSQNITCGICSRTSLVSGVNDLSITNPELLVEWHPTLNTISPQDILATNKTILIWWKCSKCGHEWQCTANSRKNGSACKFCNKYGRKGVVVGANDIPTFAPHLVDEWHPTKNGNLTPYSFPIGSSKKVWWQCKEGHEWLANISRRAGISGDPSGCPYCSGRLPIIGQTDLMTTHTHLASEWHPTKNGDFTPQQALKGSDKKVWWQCKEGHEWLAAISDRSKGTECPYCVGKLPIIGETDLETLFPDIAKEWHPIKNGDLKPSDVLKSTNKKVWWRCEHGHEWEAWIGNRTLAGEGCHFCNQSKGEKKILNYLKEWQYSHERQYRIPECRNVKPLPFDFVVFFETSFCLIEYDGELHYHSFDFCGGEEGLKERRKRDDIKTQYCLNHNIPLLRIPYWDFENIEEILKNWLNKLKRQVLA